MAEFGDMLVENIEGNAGIDNRRQALLPRLGVAGREFDPERFFHGNRPLADLGFAAYRTETAMRLVGLVNGARGLEFG